MKTWLINVLDNTIEINDPQEGDNNATILTVDFTGCGVDAIPKWVDFVMADGTMLPASLGNGIICTYNISNLITKDGNLHLQAYATNGTDLTYKGKVFRVPIKRSLNVSGNTSEYTIGVVEALQNSISEALIQVETIWDAYEAGTLGGASAYQVAVNNGFVGTEAEWLLSLKGADGADGTNGTNGTNGLDGADGLSAYQVAVQNGFVGTEAQWLLSLVGATGADGQDGSNFTILGQYATLGALQTAHPTGSAGDAWAVGTSEASDLYIWDTVTNSWKDIGQVGINMTADSVTVEDIDENYTGLTVEEVLAELPSKFSETTHGHTISEVTGLDTALAGKEPTFSKNTGFNKNFGTTAGTVVEGNDSRLSDARTPTAHTHAISDVTGLVDSLNSIDDKAPIDAPALTGNATLDGRKIISNSTSVGTEVTKIWSGTQAQYDAIGTKDANTLYFIV